MASITNITLVDDLDGTVADETITFGLDGKEYEIDLSAGNASDLRAYLEEFVKAARKVGRGGKPVTRSRNSELPRMRAWLQANGYSVGDRGRIPWDLKEIYRKGTADQ
jgi:hypothetical protein